MRFFQTHILPEIQSLHEQIYNHAYNVELFAGTLSPDIFQFYLQQDFMYLYRYAKILEKVTRRFKQEYPGSRYIAQFQEYTAVTYAAQQALQENYLEKRDVHHGFFSSKIEQPPLIPAMTNYINYLDHLCTTAALPVIVASLLACFWAYTDTGMRLISKTDLTDNPYKTWIEMQYIYPQFIEYTEALKHTMEELAATMDQEIQTQMIMAFKQAIQHELHAWHEIYHRSPAGVNEQPFIACP